MSQIARYEQDSVMGKPVDLQAVKTEHGFRAEWSFDGGDNWNALIKNYLTADMAILMARAGALVGYLHGKKVKERGES